MALVKSVSTYFEDLDSKKNSLRKAILTLAVEWKDLDEHLDLTKNCFDECVIDLKSKEDKLDYSVAENRELDQDRVSLDLQLAELECREESFRCFQQAQVAELEMKEQQLNVIRTWIRERMEKCELKEERLSVQKQSMEVLLEKIEREKEEFEEIQKSVGEKLNEIRLRERNYEVLSKEVLLIQGRMESWAGDLDSKEKQLKVLQKLNQERNEELDALLQEWELKEENHNAQKKLLEVQLEEIGREKRDIEDSKVSVNKKLNEINLRERKCEDLCNEANMIQDWAEKRGGELYSKEEQFALIEEQLKAMEKLNKERYEELDAMEQECKFKEERLHEERKSIEELLEKFEGIKNSVDEKLNEISLKERNCEDLSEEANLIQHEIERQARELDLKEEQVAFREEQIKEMQRLNKECREELDVVEKECKFKEERLSLERREFEDIKKSVAKKLNDISLKERRCEDRSIELDKVKDWIERRARELDSKEEEIELREQQLEAMQILNEGRCKELDAIALEFKLKEEKFSMEKKSMELLVEKIEKDKKEFDDTKMSVAGKLNEISLKEKKCEDLSREVNLILDQVERRAIELDSKEQAIALREEQLKTMPKMIKGRCEEINVIASKCKLEEDSLREKKRSLEVPLGKIEKEKEELGKLMLGLDSAKKLNNTCSETLDWKPKQLDLAQKHGNQHFNDFHSKSKQLKDDKELFDRRCGEFESKEKQLEERLEDCELKEKQLEKRLEDFKSKEKQLEGRLREFELEVKQFKEQSKALESMPKQLEESVEEILSKEKHHANGVHSNAKVERVEVMPGGKLPVGTQDFVTMDGRGLLVYINVNYKDSMTLNNEVCEILRLSSDPTKLVLDAVEGFYPSPLKKEDVEFETVVVREGCVILLEQLMVLSPQIQPHVRVAALKLAGEWKMKLEGYPNDGLEALAFILLLASYKLSSEFDANEILIRLEFFSMRRLAPQMCWALGFSEKVPDIIARLVRDNKHCVAVGFIVEFKLVTTFSPVRLLRDYLRISEELIRHRCHVENNTVEAQDKEIQERIACMRNIVECIKYHKLECGKWCSELESWIGELEKQKGQKQTVPTNVVKDTVHKPDDKNTVQNSDVNNRGSRSMKALSFLLANMDGKNLLLFLSKHTEEHELMRVDFSDALRRSPDPAKLVLDAVEVFYTAYLVKADSGIEANVVRTCIFLLEELMMINFTENLPAIKPQVQEVARELALDWKRIIQRHTTYGLTLGFLLFVGSYGLALAFDLDQIFELYKTIGKHKHASELFRALKLPVCNILDQSAPEDLQLSQTVTTACVSDSYSLWDEISKAIQYTSDPARLVLDAVEGSYYSMLENRNISKVEVLRTFNFLLIRLLRIPLEVKPQVRDQAKKFAVDWKENLRHNHFEVGCFLLFLANYKVLFSFHTDELLSLFEMVYDDRTAYSLFQSIGLSDQVPDFIRRLVERGLHLDAIKYVNAFNLVEKFSPVTLLEDYISNVREAAEEILENGHKPFSTWEVAAKIQVDAFKSAMNCARLHNLKLRHPFKNLEKLIERLEQQFFDLKKSNKKRKRERFPRHLPSDKPFERHHPEPLPRAALSAEATLPGCSERTFHPVELVHSPYHHHSPPRFPMEPPLHLQPCPEDFYSATAMSISPRMSQHGPDPLAYGGYPPFGFASGGNYGSCFNYNAGLAMDYWPQMGPHPDWRW